MLTIGGFGSEERTSYFFLLEDNTVSVRCGCFAGTLDEWKEKVRETHGHSKIAKAYLMAADAVMMQIESFLDEKSDAKEAEAALKERKVEE